MSERASKITLDTRIYDLPAIAQLRRKAGRRFLSGDVDTENFAEVPDRKAYQQALKLGDYFVEQQSIGWLIAELRKCYVKLCGLEHEDPDGSYDFEECTDRAYNLACAHLDENLYPNVEGRQSVQRLLRGGIWLASRHELFRPAVIESGLRKSDSERGELVAQLEHHAYRLKCTEQAAQLAYFGASWRGRELAEVVLHEHGITMSEWGRESITKPFMRKLIQQTQKEHGEKLLAIRDRTVEVLESLLRDSADRIHTPAANLSP